MFNRGTIVEYVVTKLGGRCLHVPGGCLRVIERALIEQAELRTL